MDIKKDLIIPLIVSLVVLITGIIFCIWGPFDPWITILYTVFLTVITFVIFTWVKIFFDLPEIIDNRISRMADFSALWTENHSFENTLGILWQNSSIGNGVKWLVAKFISYKLGKDFRDCNNVQIVIRNIKGDEYSQLLERLIYECKDEILMTCPYASSEEWFKTLEISDCLKCGSNCTIPNILKKTPSHIIALINNKRPKTRIRLITKKWELLPTTSQKEKNCKKHFDMLSKKANLQVWMKERDSDSGLKDRDLNILDGVLLEWNKDKGECKLMVGAEEVDVLKRNFFEKAKLDKLPEFGSENG